MFRQLGIYFLPLGLLTEFLSNFKILNMSWEFLQESGKTCVEVRWETRKFYRLSRIILTRK